MELYEKKLKPPNCNDRKLKLFLITDNEIDKMGFLNRKDYAYLYSSKAFLPVI